MNYIDAAVQRLQSLPRFHLQSIDDSGRPVAHWDVSPVDLAPEIITSVHSYEIDLETVGALVVEWGVRVARAQRVWEIRERHLRTWKARKTLELKELTDEEGKPKKLTQAQIEATYRLDEAYETLNQEVEKAAEAHQCALAVLEAVRAKVQTLRSLSQKNRP